MKQIIFQMINRVGLAMVGTEITRVTLMQTLKKVVGHTISRQVLKFEPVLGWSANAAIGFCAMKQVGNSHVRDCYIV